MGRKKEKKCPPVATWLVTFSDLVTLLLTFFVLLLSMSSMDQSFLTAVSVSTQQMGLMNDAQGGKVTAKVREVVEMLERPWEILERQHRIKDMIFPDDVLPPEIDRQELEKNLRILLKPDGVALVFTDRLMFETGSSQLRPGAQALLDAIIPIMWRTNAPVNVAGYADSVGGHSPEQYTLSAERALSVLTYFVEQGMPDKRFSFSAEGPKDPVATNETEEGRAQNRRVEILLRTTRPLGGYM